MFKNTCFVTLVKIFLITATMPFAVMAFLVMCVRSHGRYYFISFGFMFG